MSAEPMYTGMIHETAKKRRFGLVPLQIGREIAHKITIEMPIATPRRPIFDFDAPIPQTITAPRLKKPSIQRDANGVPTKCLPGSVVYLHVHDFTRLSKEERESCTWICRHPDCVGNTWKTRDDLIEGHDDQQRLVEDAERNNGHPHLYYGVIEKPAVKATEAIRDKDGRVTKPAVEGSDAVCMIVSEEL